MRIIQIISYSEKEFRNKIIVNKERQNQKRKGLTKSEKIKQAIKFIFKYYCFVNQLFNFFGIQDFLFYIKKILSIWF